jgi:septal ring factor EnvC (AmiA/AmiB activator)
MSWRAVAIGLAGLALMARAPMAQPAERERTESLSRRAADRLQALHREADALAAQERTLLGDLRRLEVEREIRTTELASVRTEARSVAREVTRLDAQVTLLTEQSQAALPDLRARLVTVYKLGRGQYARLLLSASDLRQFGQAVRLVSALAEQDRQRVRQHQTRLAEITAARAAARERQVQLRQLEVASETAQAAADRAFAAREALVHDIDTRRDLNAQFSSELLLAQQRLQASLNALSSGDAATLPIAPFKGALDWPAPGTIRQPFGATAGGRPPLRGVEIVSADAGPVRAVHEGTVVYADIFAGYGRLVILDHGGQTFSLYGNLGQIDVAKGAHVEHGDPVGTVSPSGGSDGAFYFELRVDGRAVDPVQWLSKR